MEISKCCAMRGRGNDNLQQLELRNDNLTNTIATVTKDNLVLTVKGDDKCLIAEQSRAEQSLCPTSDKRGLHRMSSSGNCRSELSQKQNTQRKSPRERTDMSDIDNGEYP